MNESIQRESGTIERGGGGSLELRIPPDARFARTVRDALIGFAAVHGIGEYDAESLLFAVGEALANAVEHSRSRGDITVRCEIDDDRIVATVIDSGSGFAGISMGSTSLPDAFAERGRGWPIMQRCTDFLAVESAPGKGTAVTLGRYLKNQPRKERYSNRPA